MSLVGLPYDLMLAPPCLKARGDHVLETQEDHDDLFSKCAEGSACYVLHQANCKCICHFDSAEHGAIRAGAEQPIFQLLPSKAQLQAHASMQPDRAMLVWRRIP